jgi:hypothetical protein
MGGASEIALLQAQFLQPVPDDYWDIHAVPPGQFDPLTMNR